MLGLPRKWTTNSLCSGYYNDGTCCHHYLSAANDNVVSIGNYNNLSAADHDNYSAGYYYNVFTADNFTR